MSGNKDKDDSYEYDDGGLSDDQWSDDTVYDNDVYWDPVLKRRFKTRHGDDANASNHEAPQPSKDVPKAAGSDDSWGEPNKRESPKDSSQLPRNDDSKKMSAPGNDGIAVAEERGRSINDRDGSDKPDNFIDPASQYNPRAGTNNHGYEGQNSNQPRGDGFESRPAVSRESSHHSTAPPVFDNTMPNTYRYDQPAGPGRNQEPQARHHAENRYQHPHKGQGGYQAPPPNPNYGTYEPHHSTAPPHNQAPHYPPGDMLSREMSGMTISRGDQRSRVPMEPSSLVEAEYEGWNSTDLNKELKRIEERTRAIMNVMHRKGENPQYLDCSEVALVTQPSRAVNHNSNMHRDGQPPSGSIHYHQPPTSYIVPTSTVPSQPQQTRALIENERTYNQTQHQQYAVQPSYAPSQHHNYPQPQNSGTHQPQPPYQDYRQPSGVVYPPQQSQGHDVYATNSQQSQHQQYNAPPSNVVPQPQSYPQAPPNWGSSQQQQQYQDSPQSTGAAYPPQQNQGPNSYATTSQQPQYQQCTVPPSNVVPQPQHYPQNSRDYQENQDYRQPAGVAYPPQHHQGPAMYATPSHQPQHQQYTVPPSVVQQPHNYSQNSGNYQQNQDYRHQVSTPQQSYGSAEYQKPVYPSQPHQYSDQPAREPYPYQQNSGYGAQSYQQTQPYQSTSSTVPQYQQSIAAPQPYNYPYQPQNSTNHQQQYYQDSRQPSRQVSPTQHYPVYSASKNYQQPQQQPHVAVPPSQDAPQTYNYNQQQYYQDSRQPSRQVSPTQQYPAYSASANYQQPQQQPNAAVPYSHIPPQPSHYSREDAEIASYSQQAQAAVPVPQEMPQNTNTNQLPQQQQASPESSATVPSDPTRVEAAPSLTDAAQPRYNKKGKLIIEPSEEIRQWHMKRRQAEKAEKAARFRESPAYTQYTKVREDYERRKAAGEYN